MKYRVHLYCEVRVPIEVEADSQVAAIEAAAAQYRLNPTYWFSREGEDAENIRNALVDEDGDPDYLNSLPYQMGDDGWEPVKEL